MPRKGGRRKKQAAQKARKPVESTDEESVETTSNASDATSGDMSRAGPSTSRESSSSSVSSPSSSSPESPMWNQFADDENDKSFTMEGQCAIRIGNEKDRILRKVDIVPLVGRVGVIGCGPMARAIIPYLIKTGHNVYAYNRTKEKLMELPLKPTIVLNPAALVAKCDVILCCVSGSGAVKNVMEGENGILKAMDRHVGRAYVEMTSVHPATITKYAQQINARGGTYLNAQIGRTRPAAYLGCSVITASGDRETFEKCVTCFAAFSSYAFYQSAIVTEATIASVGQTVIESTAIITLSDSMLAADAMGLPKDALVNILEKDPRRMAMLPVAAIIMIEDRPDVFIPLKHVLKNLRMAISLKKSDLSGNEFLVTAIHVCTQVLNQYPEAKDADISCLYKLRTPEYVKPVPK